MEQKEFKSDSDLTHVGLESGYKTTGGKKTNTCEHAERRESLDTAGEAVNLCVHLWKAVWKLPIKLKINVLWYVGLISAGDLLFSEGKWRRSESGGEEGSGEEKGGKLCLGFNVREKNKKKKKGSQY